MINLIIDNKPVTVEEGTTILEAAKQINIKIPALCYMDLGELKMVNKVSSCRICSVEVEGRRNLAPSCSTPVAEGMKIHTNSKRVLFARRKLLELMLSNHPFDCLTCNKSTDCDLQTLAVQFGVNAKHFKGVRSSFPVDTSSQALRRDPEKCIMCRAVKRCVMKFKLSAPSRHLAEVSIRCVHQPKCSRWSTPIVCIAVNVSRSALPAL